MALRQATARRAREADVLDVQQAPVNPDLALVDQDRGSLQEFLTGLTRFFGRARVLELKAKATLTTARTLQPPKSGDEDAHVQTFIRTANAGRKEVEEHWSITTVVHGLHRKLTAARARATTPYEDAATIAQGLHNRYAEEAKRKAREEEDRLRREAEARARQDRERELEQLEQQALDAEAATDGLSEREDTFVAEYHRTHDGYRAASQAGYAQPRSQAERLLANPKILRALQAFKERDATRRQAEAIRTAPVRVETPVVKPDLVKAGSDREHKAAEIFDADAFLAAVVDPTTRAKLGIPVDTIAPNAVKLNEYARSLGELINRWPGVRLKKTTKTI